MRVYLQARCRQVEVFSAWQKKDSFSLKASFSWMYFLTRMKQILCMTGWENEKSSFFGESERKCLHLDLTCVGYSPYKSTVTLTI